jgi:hypothetical protein
MGAYYALSKRNGIQFVKERLKRLLVPLIFGIIFIVPPQVYIERLDKGQFSGSYLSYWPMEAFKGIYPEGNAAWLHLWFILYLLIFSLILIPVLTYMHKHPDIKLIKLGRAMCSMPFGLYILIIPFFLSQIFIYPYYPPTNRLINDWFNLVNYGVLFFFGFLLISLKENYWNYITKYRLLHLLCGIVAFTLLMYPSIIWTVIPYFRGIKYIIAFLIVFSMWSWIFALCGYAAVYLNKPSWIIKYCNEAVYPFYILHETILIILAYYLKHTDIGFFPKFSILIIGTFGVTWIIYEFGVKRYAVIRPLFGLKKKNIGK